MTKHDDDDLPALARFAKEAGNMVMEKREDIIANRRWRYKDGDLNSPVTPADIMSDELIAGRLKKLYPDIPILSEENRSGMKEKALKARERFEVDSLDNTPTYIEEQRYDGYSVNIGRVKDGVPVAGAVYFPQKRELYFTGEDGKTAYLQHGDEAPERINAKGLPLRKPLKAAAGWHHHSMEHLAEGSYTTAKHPGQYRALLTATGECDVTCADNGFKTWDIAATHAILKAAGAEIVGKDGQPVRYGASENAGYTVAGGIETLKALGLMDKAIRSQQRLS